MSDVDLPDPEDQQEASAEKPKRAYKRRHDVEGTAPKKGRRKPQARFDSDVSAPIDGFGDPLAVKMAPGWIHLWVTQRDFNRWQSRPWEDGRWGDKRILSYPAVAGGKEGAVIQSPQGSMTLKVMRKTDFDRMHAQDPNRALHQKNKDDERNRRVDAQRLQALNL